MSEECVTAAVCSVDEEPPFSPAHYYRAYPHSDVSCHSGVEDAISAGFVRILTGQGMKDMKILTSIAQAAAGRVDILPGKLTR